MSTGRPPTQGDNMPGPISQPSITTSATLGGTAYNGSMDALLQSQLGKASDYSEQHDPGLLFAIPRREGRKDLPVNSDAQFVGCDIWHAWELSWLNARGRPVNAVARFVLDCHSPNLIESKSFKLYLNSLAQTRFADHGQLVELLRHELGGAAGTAVDIELFDPSDSALAVQALTGESLDQLDIACTDYGPPRPELLASDASAAVSETLVSSLFRSNCPVTGQPDWASVQIAYHGPRMDRAALLRYLVSYRRHSGFHEQCVERIFIDLHQRCTPEHLDVRACFTRRGGLDINPWRSSQHEKPARQARDPRQ